MAHHNRKKGSKKSAPTHTGSTPRTISNITNYVELMTEALGGRWGTLVGFTRCRLDYGSVARNLFVVEDMPTPQEPIYFKDEGEG